MTAEQILGGHYREVIVADARSRLATAACDQRPFAERLQWFWANHFTVSLLKGSTRGLVGAFERDAIRPHIAGRFETLLVASTTHPAMLRYLDNSQSAGPHSRVVALEPCAPRRRAAGRRLGDDRPRVTGINENLAREVLELHTLGAESARQRRLHAGRRHRLRRRADGLARRPGSVSSDARSTPTGTSRGPRRCSARATRKAPMRCAQLLRDLARHPATAHFVSTKLARHFVADEPPPALVERLTAVYLKSDGNLAEVYRELLRNDAAWSARRGEAEDAGRVRGLDGTHPALGERLFERHTQRRRRQRRRRRCALGQRIQAAPSPAGWSDRAEDWLGPDAVWKRVEWATRIADRSGQASTRAALAAQSLGPLLSAETTRQIERAADGPQALALLLLAPEFQRR